MVEKESYQVGTNLYVVTIARTSAGIQYTISPKEIVSVGRKYISVLNGEKFTQLCREDIYLLSVFDKYGVDHNTIAFGTEREAEAYIEAQHIIRDIHDNMTNLYAKYNHGAISIDSLREISRLLNPKERG